MNVSAVAQVARIRVITRQTNARIARHSFVWKPCFNALRFPGWPPRFRRRLSGT
jgi:hypothetical protein